MNQRRHHINVKSSAVNCFHFENKKLSHKFLKTSFIYLPSHIIMAPTKNSKNTTTTSAPGISSTTAPSSPARASMSSKKPFSPIRKAGGMIRDVNTSKPKMDIYELGIINCGLGPVFPVIIEKEKGKGVAYNVPNLRRLSELATAELDKLGFLGTYHKRDPNDADKPLVVVNIKLSEYNVDVLLFDCGIMLREGAEATERDYYVLVSKFASVFNQISKQSEAAGEYQYGAPVYVNKGMKTPVGGACLFDYFMTYDCVKIMKQFCDGVDTKAELMMHSDRDNILELVFGDSEKGLEVVLAIDEMIYDTL